MKIFYGSSEGKPDVSGDSSIESSFETALEIFRGLDARSGFIGINLDSRFVLQIARVKHEKTRIELLDTSIPAVDACEAETKFAEHLIRAAFEGQNVFQIARADHYDWDHHNMS
jgi:hypothetical protein